MKRTALGLVVGGFAALIVSCGGDSGSSDSTAFIPVHPDLDTCTLCSMVVREQPVPRAQVVHRSGARAHLCSISELVPYLAVPSPDGRPTHFWVEVLRVDDGSAPTLTEPRPWIPAAGAWFVVGGPERPVMGESVLAYATSEDARSIAEQCGGTALSWNELLEHLSREESQ